MDRYTWASMWYRKSLVPTDRVHNYLHDHSNPTRCTPKAIHPQAVWIWRTHKALEGFFARREVMRESLEHVIVLNV